jgi:hypothetical protein
MIIYYFDFIFLLFLIYKRSYFNIQLFNEFEFNKLLNLNLITDPDQNLASITVHTILIFSRKKHEKNEYNVGNPVPTVQHGSCFTLTLQLPEWSGIKNI